MRKTGVFALVSALAVSSLLAGCVPPIDSDNASAEVDADSQIVLSDTNLSLTVTVDVSDQHSETVYGVAVMGRTDRDEWVELATTNGIGDFRGNVEVTFARAGLWATEVHILDQETSELLLQVGGPTIEVFDSASLSVKPATFFDTWITGEPMPLVPSINPERLASELDWRVEILRGPDWEEITALDLSSPVVPPFSEDDEAIQSMRLVAYDSGNVFAAGEPFDVRIASPGTLIREAWNRENGLSTPEELWEEISSSTYPGIQNPTGADRDYVIRVYERQGMPRTSVLLETLVKVPNLDVDFEYNRRRPCSDPEALAGGIEGIHFFYDIVWYLDRISSYSTFFEGEMFQHRSLCY